MLSNKKRDAILQIIEMNKRLDKEIKQAIVTPNMSNTKIVEHLINMGANINQSPSKQPVHPMEDLLAVVAKLLGAALIEQLPPAPDTPLDPFWVNDTGFRLAFAKASDKLKERAALPLPTIAAQLLNKQKL